VACGSQKPSAGNGQALTAIGSANRSAVLVKASLASHFAHFCLLVQSTAGCHRYSVTKWQACLCRATLRAVATPFLPGVPSQDRVLRYPDGLVRTIRYPEPRNIYSAQPHTSALDTFDADEHDADLPGWVICGEHDSGCTLAADYELDSSLPGAAPVGVLWGDEVDARQTGSAGVARRVAITEPQSSDSMPSHDVEAMPQPWSATQRSTSALPDSPAAFLRFLQSDTFKRQQQDEQARVAGSYELLTGSPWVESRQLTVLALRRGGAEHPTVYTLPTSMPRVRLFTLASVAHWLRTRLPTK
jgi:hypothetical protein